MSGTGFVIQRVSDRYPNYCSPSIGRRLGVGANGWTEDADEAMHFARSKDAQDFINAFLFPQSASLSITPHNWE